MELIEIQTAYIQQKIFQQQQETVTPERMKKLETMFQDDFPLTLQEYHSLASTLTKNRARLMEVSVSREDERACSTGLGEVNILQESILDLYLVARDIRERDIVNNSFILKSSTEIGYK